MERIYKAGLQGPVTVGLAWFSYKTLAQSYWNQTIKTSLAQTSVSEHECNILTNGSVQQYAADTKTWKAVVAANAPLGIRQSNGTVWRLNHGMQSIGTRATKLWAGNGEFWQWQATTHTLWAMGRATGGEMAGEGLKSSNEGRRFLAGSSLSTC